MLEKNKSNNSNGIYFKHPLLDTFSSQEKELKLTVQVLKEKIDEKISNQQKSLFNALNRDFAVEALLPFHVFQTFGVSQPHWFTLRAPNTTEHVCLALINKDFIGTDTIHLSPYLYHIFKRQFEISIKPVKQDILNISHTQLFTDFFDNQFPPVVDITLNYIRQRQLSTEEQQNLKTVVLNSFKDHPRVIQVGDIMNIEGMMFKVLEFKIIDPHKEYFFKILELQKDKEKRISDIMDSIVINEFSYNSSPAYLVHSRCLKNVQINFADLNTDTIPRYRLRYSGQLDLLRKTEYFQQAKKQICNFIQTNLSQNLSLFQLYGALGQGKTSMIKEVADKYGLSFCQYDCYNYFNLNSLKTLFSTQIQQNNYYQALIIEVLNFDKYKLLIDQFTQGSTSKSKRDLTEMRFLNVFEDALNQLQNFLSQKSGHVFICFSTEKLNDLGQIVQKVIREKIYLKSADREDRNKIIAYLFQSELFLKKFKSEDLEALDIDEISKYLQGKSFKEIKNILLKVLGKGEKMEMKEILKKMNQMEKDRRALGEKAIKIPEVKWDDVGGLAQAKEDIIQTIMLPQEKPHLFKNGMAQRSGLLFYGPPGTGKTLLAKAIATECQMNFISVKGPELLNMYVGESEKNVRDVFERARENLPCIVFFDELDSLAPARGKGADSSQVMDRIVAQLLTEIDGLGKKTGMFVIGATNRPDLLDSALLRTGRFDKMIYLGVASTSEEKVKIIQAQTRSYKLGEDVDLMKVASMLPKNFTGADFSAMTSESYMLAVKEKIENLEYEIEQYKRDNGINMEDELLPETYLKLKYGDDKERADQEIDIVVRQKHFENGLGRVTPSISMEELERYEELRDKFSTSN